MIKGAIFDVDGTLMDSMWIWTEAFNRFAQAHSIKPQFDVQKEFFTMSLAEGAAFIKREFDLSQSPTSIIEEIASLSGELYMSGGKLKPNVPEFLQALSDAGIPMTIVTSGERSLVENVFTKLGIAHHFQHIYAATNEHIPKRMPTLWERARTLMGSSPQETWVFEDALYAIKVTASLGFRTVQIADSQSAQSQGHGCEAELYWQEYPSCIPPQMFV